MASDTTNFINIPITPGGMLGDIVEDELGNHQHQRVENLRQIKKGEWELPPGYKNTLTGLTNAKVGIEVDEDISGDRFRLIQDGVNIVRVEHNISNSPLFGYENEPPVTLSLPSGVTIDSTSTLRFFQFRGIVRISGASEPLHYSFVDRTVFVGDDSFTIQKWVLEKAILLHVDNDLEVLTATPIPDRTPDIIADNKFALFLKFFYEFDDGQFQLLRLPDASAITDIVFGFPEEIFPDTFAYGAHIELRIPGSTLLNNMFNERITGIGIAFATVPYALPIDVLFAEFGAKSPGVYREELEPFFVPEIVRISKNESTEIKKIGFGLTAISWDSTTPTVLQISDPLETFAGNNGNIFLPPEAGYLGIGVKVAISFGGSTINATVSAINFGTFSTNAILTTNENLSSLFGATGIKNSIGFNITVEWHYSAANGYTTFFGLNLLALGTLYEEFAGIPTGTLQNTPNWEAIQFLAERSYISGQTGDIGSSLVSGGTIQVVTIVEDTFTDTNGIVLTAHTMNIGNGWISGDGNPSKWEIQTNEARDSAGGASQKVYTEVNRSDKIKITGEMTLNDGMDNISIYFRYVDTQNDWHLFYEGSTVASPAFHIVRRIAGSAIIRDSEIHTVADGTPVTFEIELDGSSITCKILTPETHTLTITDTTHLSATKVGFSSEQFSAALMTIDDLKVTEEVLVPTGIPVANDAFTDSNGVALTAHTMPLGNGWTSAGAQWEIQSNEARDSGAGSGVQVITDLNRSDNLVITGKIMINDPLDETRISFRHFTINDEWYFAYSGSNAPKFDIRRVIASVHTTQQTQVHTVADGTFVSFQITLSGSSIELKILSPEVYTLQVTDSTHLTETKLAFFPLATNAGVTRIDDLIVVETVESFLIASQEEDTVRHSPIGQFDNFPIGNVIQTEVGTTDKILNLAKRDDKLTILKARSLSTGGFVGNFYSEDIGFSKHGLFSVLGVLRVTISLNAEEANEFLLIMDQDDLYLYNGNQIVSFFEKVELREFYRTNVTVSSFMLFDKLNGEILFFLGTEILVWNMHVPEFYIRKTDIIPLYGFLDADNSLIIGNATKQITFNHGLTPFDETISYLIRTKINDLKTPHRFKKVKDIHSYLSSGEDVTITLSDVQGAIPGTTMQLTRGVVDHWIAECAYITAPGCYDTDLDSWLSTQVGRTEFETSSSGAFTIGMLQAELNGRDVVTIPNSPTNFGQILNSGNNSAYAYMHDDKGWFALVWKQVETSLPGDHATLWGNNSYGAEIAGFQFATLNDAAGDPNSLRFRITRAVGSSAILFDTGTQKVKMGDWNFVIVSWEETTGRDGLRMDFNGTIIDKDNSVFLAAFTSNLSVRPIHWARRAGPQAPVRPAEIMIAEMGAGNVGLTNAEISNMADHIENYWGLGGLIPLKNKTITSPTNLKPRIEHNCNYLFKELQVEFSNTTNSTSLTAKIRDFLLKIERWQKV